MKSTIRLLLGWALLASWPVAGQDVAFKLVAPAEMRGASVKRSVLADVYLRKVTRWGDGAPIQPVDQSAASPVRVAFSQQVLGKPVDAIRIYWMKQMSSPGGARPPAAKDSDEEVIAFVASQPGSVGYVSLSTPLPPTLKTLEIVD